MRASRRLPQLVMVALLLSATGVAADPVTPESAGVVLRDQLGGSDSVAAHKGETTVAMVVTAARLRNLRNWQRDLQARFEAVDFVLIADVPRTPPATFVQVSSKLAKRVPEGVSVLIDLEGRWATELGLDTGRPNLLIFDADGALVDRFRGRHKADLVEVVSGRLEAVLQK